MLWDRLPEMHKTIPFHEGIFIISYEDLYAFTCITQLRNGIDITY